MFACKKTLTAIVCCMFLAAVSLFPGVTAAQAETVVIDGPFGDVPIGETSVSAIQISASATNGVTLTGLSLVKGASSQFSVKTTLPGTGLYLGPGESVAIEVAYSPTVPGPVSDTLIITTLTTSVWSTVPGEIHLNLTGTGIDAQASQAEPADIGGVKGLLAFFDSAVAAGQLEGKGKGKSAKKRLKAVRKQIKSTKKMLKADKKMLKADKKNKACKRLGAISKKLGTHVQGGAAGELADRLAKLTADLGCK